jgi:rod shape-determining protein MreD
VTREVSVVRKALAAVILAVALFAAVVIQLTVVNRLPLPGPVDQGSTGAPDLVLLLVAAIAVATGPATGAFTGFAGGLALDIAPPAAHYAGEYALVFCLVGYAAARVVRAIRDRTGEHDPITAFTVMAIAVAAGEAGKAALGMLLSDPNVTSAAVRSVLPAAILYDLLLSPLVYWLVARVTHGAVGWRAAPGRAPAPEFGALQPASVFRQASAGAAPKLRFAGTGESYGSQSPARRVPKLRFAGTGESYGNQSPPRRVPKLRLSGTGESHRSQSPARRVPKLRLSGARSAVSIRTTAAGSPGAPLFLAGGRTPRLNFAGDLPVRSGTRASQARTPGKNWLRKAASPTVPATKRAARGPARGWLRSTSPGGKRGGRAGGSAGGLPRGFMGAPSSGSSRIAVRPARSPAEALAARSAPSGLSALSGAGTPLARRRSPRAGWLRGSGSAVPAFSARRLSPRRGWLGGASRPRTVIGSGVGGTRGTFRRGRTARGNWYAASPSGAWLRRGRHPWRKRLHLPGGRPPVPPGARVAMAKGAIATRAREPRLFRLLGGRR